MTTRLGPLKAPLRRPMKALRSPLVSGLSDTPDPRYPCQRCGKRPSEVIVAGNVYLCLFCYNRQP
jgi:hypothetical protein